MLNFTYNYLIIYFLLYLTIQTNKKFFKFNNYFFLFSLFFHLSLTLIYTNLFEVGDWDTYLWDAQSKEFKLTVGSFLSSHFVITVIIFLSRIMFLSDISVIFIFSLISYFGILIFVKNLVKLGFEKKIVCYLLFIPGIHFWTGVPGKDSLLLFCLSLFFYFYIDRKIIFSLFFILIVCMIRPHIGLIFLVSIALTEFFLIQKYKNKFLMLLTTIICFYGIMNFPKTQGFFLNNSLVLSDNIFLQILNQLNAISQKYNSSSSFYGGGNILSNIFNYILFPTDFIFKKTSIFIDFSIYLEICTFIFISTLILKHKKELMIDKKIIYFLSICVLLYLFVMPQVFFNYGLNIRQKWMILPFVIYLFFLLKNLFVKMNKI